VQRADEMKLTPIALLTLGAALSSGCGTPGEPLGSGSQAATVCATGATVQGVDVSTYQGTVDWASVHGSGRDFAFARVSDGTTTPDDTFATNWAAIKAAGMVRGAYQFFRASQDPTAQANLLLAAVGTFAAGDLPPVADVEVLDGESGATLVANLATWVSVIKAKTGRTPMIYASPGFWDALPSTGQFSSELSWVANWDVSCPDTSTPWTTWSFWQTADNGSVAGISGAVDLDVFNGTLAELTSGPASATDAGTEGEGSEGGPAPADGGNGNGNGSGNGSETGAPATDDGGVAVTPADAGRATSGDAAAPATQEDAGQTPNNDAVSGSSSAGGGCVIAPGRAEPRTPSSVVVLVLAACVSRRRKRVRRGQNACLPA
jgi:GH25 family lysozyme M1 (1,4-beta-N-acetylmuramidase)